MFIGRRIAFLLVVTLYCNPITSAQQAQSASQQPVNNIYLDVVVASKAPVACRRSCAAGFHSTGQRHPSLNQLCSVHSVAAKLLLKSSSLSMRSTPIRKRSPTNARRSSKSCVPPEGYFHIPPRRLHGSGHSDSSGCHDRWQRTLPLRLTTKPSGYAR